jgi:transposase
MPAERVSMRRVREILRYRFGGGLGHKAISQRVGAAPSTVRETLRRVAAAELSWPLGEDVSDAVLEAALYRAAGIKTGHRRCPEPNWGSRQDLCVAVRHSRTDQKRRRVAVRHLRAAGGSGRSAFGE